MNIQFLQGACNHDDGTATNTHGHNQACTMYIIIFCRVVLCAYSKAIMFVQRKGCTCQLDYF